jgi:hypothetical protein
MVIILNVKNASLSHSVPLNFKTLFQFITAGDKIENYFYQQTL